MKKIIALLMIISSLCAFQTTAFMESQKVNVTLNGTPIQFDAQPFIENDRTLVPVRKIFEAVGANVMWDENTKTAIAGRLKNNTSTFVAIQIGSESAFINSEKKKLDVPAIIVEDRTFVPLRFVMEALGENVQWDSDTYTVNITTN